MVTNATRGRFRGSVPEQHTHSPIRAASELWGLEPRGDADAVVIRGPWGESIHRHREATVGILGHLTQLILDLGSSRARLHGGAAALDGVDGDRTVMVLGRSGAGKSTLIAHLGAQGFALLNDEQVALFPEHRLIGGFTRPVSIREEGLAHLPHTVRHDQATDRIPPSAAPRGGSDLDADASPSNRLLTMEQLGTVHRLASRPSLVILPDRDDVAETVTWDRLAPAEGVLELCANSLDLARYPTEGLHAIGWLAATVPIFRLRYRDAADATAAIRHLLAEPRQPTVRWEVKVSASGDRPDQDRASTHVAPGVISLHIDDDIVLYNPTNQQVLRLNPSAASVWNTLPWDHGARPDLPEHTAPFVSDLIGRGFLTEARPPATKVPEP